MNRFQWIALPILALLFLRALVLLARGARPRWWLLLRAAVWLGAAIAVLWPDFTTRIARALGIGRGADLIIYIVTILFIVSFFFLLQRYRRLEVQLTSLVRHLAIDEAERHGASPDDSRTSAPDPSRTAKPTDP